MNAVSMFLNGKVLAALECAFYDEEIRETGPFENVLASKERHPPTIQSSRIS